MSEYSIELGAKIEELRRDLESRTVECPHVAEAHFDIYHNQAPAQAGVGVPFPITGYPCSGCGSDSPFIGRIPNPATVPLLDVVSYYSEHHEECVQATAKTGVGCLKVYASKVDGCRGTGRFDRDWSSLPFGALAGALLHALFVSPRIAISGNEYMRIIIDPFNPDLAAIRAVLIALEYLN